MWLFGSRRRGDHRPDSDIDIFLDDGEEIPSEWLIVNGGPVDAFHLPGDDGWGWAVGDEERALLVWDNRFMRIDDPRPIDIAELTSLVDEVQRGRILQREQ